MAAINNLYSSWNFDKVTGSDSYGSFITQDSANSHDGKAHSFIADNGSFVTKEYLITNKKIHIDTIESEQTIQVIEDEDDARIDKIHKPSKVQLMIENSMYQIISDEMLNMFSSIDALSFKFNEPYNKYRDSYTQLDYNRKFFFSKVLEKPDLEKYIEYYKWLDSSLGDMIDHLIPESANGGYGLKTTVESHILERSKYKHQLPLTIESNNLFDKTLPVITSNSFIGTRNNSSSYDATNHNRRDDMYYVEDRLKSINIDTNTIQDIRNVLNKNFKKNYEVFQTSENNLKNRESGSESVFLTKFSSGDGFSEKNRSADKKYSVYNTVNNRALPLKNKFNETLSSKTPYASTSSYNNISYGRQGDNTKITSGVLNLKYNTSNFIDNSFIQRNIPYSASNYNFDKNISVDGSDLNNTLYIKVPNQKIVDTFRLKNILVEKDTDSYDTSVAFVEPPITYNIPVKHTLTLPNSIEQIEIYSPLNTWIDFFSPRNLNIKNRFAISALSGTYTPNKIENTFWYLSSTDTKNFNISTTEILNTIFPRKDLIGLSEIRSKKGKWQEVNGTGRIFSAGYVPSYRAGEEYFSSKPYAENSTANNPTNIVTYWKREFEERIRLLPTNISNGAFNSLNFPLTQEDFLKFSSASLKTFRASGSCVPPDCISYQNLSLTSSYESNPKLSLYAMDGFVNYKITGSYVGPNISSIQITCSNEIYGELAPYSNFYLVKFARQTHNIADLNEIDINNLSNFFTPANSKNFINKVTKIDDFDYRPLAKPVFIQNNFFPPYLTFGDNDYKNNLNIILNKSYQVGIDCRINPYYNSVTDFEANIRHKSQQYSIVPEFIVSDNEELITDDNLSRLSTIKFPNIRDSIESEDFIVDLNKFIDKRSNKIKIKFNAIKKLAPYNNFYPQQQTVKLASLFCKEYLEDTGYASKGAKLPYINSPVVVDYEANPKTALYCSSTLIATHRTMAAMQPLFMPGILFNSIKSGIGVSWPTTPMFFDAGKSTYDAYNAFQYNEYIENNHLDYILNSKNNINWANIYIDDESMHNMNVNDFTSCYNVTGCYQLSPLSSAPVVKNLTYKLPFETILNPELEYANMLDYVASKYSGSTYINNITENYNYLYNKAPVNGATLPGQVVLPYLDPSIYSNFFGNLSNNSTENNRYLIKANLYQLIQSLKNATFKVYKSAINNFLTEVSNFFLKNQKNTEFISAPEQEFNEAVSGTIYSMNIVLTKNENFSMFNKYPDVAPSSSNTYYYVTENSLFGPPVDINTYLTSNPGGPFNPTPVAIISESYSPHEKYFSPSAYYPYTPPYYQENGIAKFKISYKADTSGKPALKNIIENLFFVPINYILTPNSYMSDIEKSEADNKKMLVKDCINYNIVRNLNTKEYNPDTGRRIADEVQYGDSWVIQTKFETPVFNFNNCSLYQTGSIDSEEVSDAKGFYELFASSSI